MAAVGAGLKPPSVKPLGAGIYKPSQDPRWKSEHQGHERDLDAAKDVISANWRPGVGPMRRREFLGALGGAATGGADNRRVHFLIRSENVGPRGIMALHPIRISIDHGDTYRRQPLPRRVRRRCNRRRRQPSLPVLASHAGELIEMMAAVIQRPTDRRCPVARCAPIPTRDFHVRSRTPRGSMIPRKRHDTARSTRGQ
jgi:hypothetical protein